MDLYWLPLQNVLIRAVSRWIRGWNLPARTAGDSKWDAGYCAGAVNGFTLLSLLRRGRMSWWVRVLRLSSAMLLGLAMLGSVVPSGSAAITEPIGPYVRADSEEPGISVLFDESAEALGEPSYLHTYKAKHPQADDDGLCKGMDDPVCQGAPNAEYSAYLTQCTSASDNNCIESFHATTPSGKVVGTLKQLLPASPPHPYTANPTLDLPAAATPNIWTLDGVKNGAGESTYMVAVRTMGSQTRASASAPWGKFSLDQLTMAVFAVKLQPAIGSSIITMREEEGRKGIGSSGAMDLNKGCAAYDQTTCAMRVAFPEDTSFGLKLRLSQSPAGWLYGRVWQPDINTEKTSSGITISIDALPVTVPVAYANSQFSALPAALQSKYQGNFSNYGKCNGDPSSWSCISLPRLGGPEGMAELVSWLPLMKEKAAALTPMWMLRTFDRKALANYGGNSARCFADLTRISMMVTTNSTTYHSGPPDYRDGSLEYEVASPHYTPANNDFKGTYDLVMRSDVAKCVYGFKGDAPMKATVQVTNDKGEASVATINQGERNGWLFIKAYNFGFSKPKISVKLTQEGTPASTSNSGTSTGTSPKPAQKKNVTIYCVKGKVVKPVTGTNPKCPSGFRKR